MAPLPVEWEARWRALSAEGSAGITEGRLQHPKATLRASEAAIDERLAQFRTRMLPDVALASHAADLRRTRAADRPGCPTCGGPVEPRGPRERHGQDGQETGRWDP